MVLVLEEERREKYSREVFEQREIRRTKPMRMIRWFSSVLAVLVIGGFLLSAVPGASAAQIRQRVIVVEPFYPYHPWGWGYPYGYSPYYVASHYGEVKIDTHRKDLSVYI